MSQSPAVLLEFLSIAFCVIGCPSVLAIDLPKAGINLSGYSFWGTELPFVDVSHMSSQWLSAPADRSALSDERSIALTDDGYPASLASDQMARSLIFTHNHSVYPTGQYTLRWKGSGDVQLNSPGVSTVSSAPGETIYRVDSANEIGFQLEISRTDPTNPVHEIRVQAPFAGDTTGTFNAKFKQDLSNYGVIRYMDWNATNNNTIANWSDRTTPEDSHWGGNKGVPYEYQIQLSNESGKDLWLTVPHLADNNYVTSLAQLVKAKLKPELRVWVEYSNEVWNPTFAQNHYANDVLRPQYGVASAAQAYGRRSAEIFDIFTQQIADPKRVVRVIAGQAANDWVLDQSLIGATVNGELKADVAAVAAYFAPDMANLYQQHVAGTVDLNSTFADMTSNIDHVSIWVANNRAIAQTRGLPLVAYEAGQSLVALTPEQQNDASFVELLKTINRDPRMGDAYTHLLDKWYGAGGSTVSFFNDTGPWSKWGEWGLKEDYLDDDSVKFMAVQKYLQRSEGGFGVWRSSFDSIEELQADLNGDGIVNAADYIMWRKVFGVGSVSVAMNSGLPVALAADLNLLPEPSCTTLFLTAAALHFILCTPQLHQR